MKLSRPRASRAAVVLPVAAVMALAACSGGSGQDPDAPSASGTSATPTAAPGVPTTPPGPPASTAPVIGASTLPPVGLDEVAAFGDGLEAVVTSVEEVDLAAGQPGEVAGPGVAVALELRNGTGARVDLGGVVVSATFTDGAPGDESSAEPSDVPTGILEPGDEVGGVWVFSRPAGTSGSVDVGVTSISSGAAVVVRS